MMMHGTIGFEGYRIRCIIGDLPNERMHEQELVVDLYVEADFSRVAVTDHLADTVDYVTMASRCREIAENGKFFMLEAYAAAVIAAIVAEFSVEEVRIRVKKEAAIPGAGCAVVELKRKRVAS